MGANARLRGVVGWRPLVMGMLEPGLVTLVVSLGLTMTSPVNGSVFWSLTPLLMPVLGYLVLGERLEIAVLGAAALMPLRQPCCWCGARTSTAAATGSAICVWRAGCLALRPMR